VANEVEFRCPVRPQILFMKWLRGEGGVITGDNTLQIACKECRRLAKRAGMDVTVLHEYNVLAELVRTIHVRRDEHGAPSDDD
jgi:hypothetical protein